MSLGGLVRRTPAVLRRKFGSTAWLRFLSSDSKAMPAWATVNPYAMSGQQPAKSYNLVAGEWTEAKATRSIIDPLNGEKCVNLIVFFTFFFFTVVYKISRMIPGHISSSRSSILSPTASGISRFQKLRSKSSSPSSTACFPALGPVFTTL